MSDFFSCIHAKEDKKSRGYKLKNITLAKAILKDSLNSYNIHIIGTNGKGSTGRFIVDALNKLGYKVGHYTSPHIEKVNERFFMNGSVVSDDILNRTHQSLYHLVGIELLDSLTYFEYATLVAMYLFKDCDYAVVEAGLGGEFDATTVFNKDISILTSVSYDHCEILGYTIKEIATTKLKSVKNSVIVAKQEHYEEISLVLNELKLKHLYACDIFNGDLNLSILNYPRFLKDNLTTAYALLKHLGIKNLEIDLFKDLSLHGRFEKIATNIIADVGHNPSSAREIFHSIDNKFILIYNTLEVKDYQSILKILKDKIKAVYILNINSKKVINKGILTEYIKSLDINILSNLELKEDENYLVYGSFYLVDEFKKVYNI